MEAENINKLDQFRERRALRHFKYAFSWWAIKRAVPDEKIKSKGLGQQGMETWPNGENDWCPADTKENFEKNREAAEKEGWTENNVSYKVNNWGFRHHEDFCEDRNGLLAIGCSNTFGIGVNYEQTWPYYVAKELGLNPINLGQPGGSIQACYRVAREWVPIIKPKVVMWLIPDPARRELFIGANTPKAPRSVSHWHRDIKLKTYWETVNESENETLMHKRAYYDAMEHVCRNTRLIKIPVTRQVTWHRAGEGDGTPDSSSMARDMMHPGPKTHKGIISPLFVDAYRAL
tara:strand:+ start:292 stop:1158 length:867 start_codon:yes stop_codon:yes gene_type:complete